MTTQDIRQRLFALQDEKFRDFHSRLIPTVPPDSIIGVRTPELRKLAKEVGTEPAFLSDLPHKYYDENQLHALIISGMKDFDECTARLEEFLPFVDNWATCDQMSVKIFKKHTQQLLPFVKKWLDSGHTYTVRYGVGCLMNYYLDSEFSPEYMEIVANIRSNEYYINMMIAWYFATALAKQYSEAMKYIEQHRLGDWTHRKAIQKAIESYRITDEQKKYLKTLK